MRSKIRAIAVAAGIIAVMTSVANANVVTLTLRFDDLVSTSNPTFVFDPAQGYSSSGVTIKSTNLAHPTAADYEKTQSFGPIGWGAMLLFVEDVTFTTNFLFTKVSFDFVDNVDYLDNGGTGHAAPCNSKYSGVTFVGGAASSMCHTDEIVTTDAKHPDGVNIITFRFGQGLLDNVSLTYDDGSGGGTTPEPGSMALAVAALGGAAVISRRRKRGG